MILNELGCIALAMLERKIDRGEDPIDLYLPLVLQAAFNLEKAKFNINELNDSFQTLFGGRISTPVLIKLVERLKNRQGKLRSAQNDYYEIVNGTNEPMPITSLDQGKRYLNELVDGLITFGKEKHKLTISNEDAKSSLINYFNNYCLSCIRIFVGEEQEEQANELKSENEQLIGQYLLWIHESRNHLNECFQAILNGFIVASTFLVREEITETDSFAEVKFFLDTPSVLQLLHYDNDINNKVMKELIELLVRYKANIRVFSHTITEINEVLNHAYHHYTDINNNSRIKRFLTSRGIKKSDFLYKKCRLEEELNNYGIEIEDIEISESIDLGELRARVINVYRENGGNNNRLEYDVKSIAKIISMRKKQSNNKLELCKSILVTSNSGLVIEAKKFYQYDLNYSGIPPVISNYHIAYLAWLKDPNVIFDLPVDSFILYTQSLIELSSKGYKVFFETIERGVQEGKYSREKATQLMMNSAIFDSAQEESLGNMNVLASLDPLEVEEYSNKKLIEEGKEQGRKEKEKEIFEAKHREEKLKEEINNIKLEVKGLKEKELETQEKVNKQRKRYEKIAAFITLSIIIAAIICLITFALDIYNNKERSIWWKSVQVIGLSFNFVWMFGIGKIKQHIIDFFER